MQDIPEVRYARSGDVHIAYQTWGSGPPIVGVPPFAQNLDMLWSDPTGYYPYFLEKYGEFATVTHFDKRGTGLSDRQSGFHDIEERIDDIRAVMDALGLQRCCVAGISEGGPMAMLFAATYPERVEKLVLMGTAARFTRTDDYPVGPDLETFDGFAAAVAERWATPESLLVPVWMPTLADDPTFRKWVVGYERACASPGAVRDALAFVRDIDVRHALSAIRAPTLILHRSGDRVVSVEHGRYVAEHIADAQYLEIPGDDHVPWVGDNVDLLLDTASEFIAGAATPRPADDRVLATVLFTDIVDSTKRASALGDAQWRTLLDRHDTAMRQEIARYGGVAVKSMGDGFLATFDSPSRAVRAARSMVAVGTDTGLPIRTGLHTGEIERRGEDVAGVAVHIAARVAALAGTEETLVSSTVRDLMLGSDFRFTDRGVHALKGIDTEWRLLSVD